MTTERDSQASDPNGSHRDSHPSPDELLAYHERTLAGAETDRVQAHLTRCAECSQVILDFAAFPRIEPVDESRRLSPSDLEEQWRSLKRETERRRRPLWQRHEVLLTLAAVLAALAIGLGLWSVALLREIQALNGPRSDVYVTAELWPAAERVRGADEVVALPPWTERVVLLLSVRRVETYDTYGVDVTAAGGGRLLTGFPVRRAPDGTFAVELPRSALGEGDLDVTLFGIRDGRRTRIADFPVTIASKTP